MWEYAYRWWFWNQVGDPMEGGWADVAEYGKRGWELVTVVTHPSVVASGPVTWTNGAWFVATFKRRQGGEGQPG